jgi:RecJ-like exonuclease
MSKQQFEEYINAVAKGFDALSGKILIVSHLDCDGVSAAAIIAKVCQTTNKQYSLMRVRELDENAIEKIKGRDEEIVIFVDLGSAIKAELGYKIQGKDMFILDHHHLSPPPAKMIRVTEINPKNFDVKERRSISSSGIAFLFAKQLIDTNGLEPIALLGAIGDSQEDQGFIGYNKKILEEAMSNKEIVAKKTIRLPMDNLTNNKQAVKDLLRKLNIPLKRDNKWVTLATLTEQEEKDLEEELLKHMSQEVKQKAYWYTYTLTNRPQGSSTKDLREFSTLMNACGRLDDLKLGVDICLGDQEAEKKANQQLIDYKSKISGAKRWIDNNPGCTIKKQGIIIIKGEDHVPADIAGTVTSIYTKTGIYPKNTIICTLAHTKDNKTKISMRITSEQRDIYKILKDIINELKGECGGHKNAAGAIIDQSQEKEFIKKLLQKAEIK